MAVPVAVRVNRALESAFGVRLQRVSRRAKVAPPKRYGLPVRGRLVPSPIFVFSSMRSGSTLLRVMLNSHSQICAPHEMHIRNIQVAAKTRGAQKSLSELGIEVRDLENMLWDRTLAAVLATSGKEHIASKTPGDVRAWRRISTVWPKARYVFLLRHPASIVESWMEAHPALSEEEAVARVRRDMEPLQRARSHLAGHTVRYEDLVGDAEATLRGLCEFLGVPFEARMLSYGEQDHGRYVRGLGDWRGKISSGTVQEARPLPAPDAVPASIRDIVEAWGY